MERLIAIVGPTGIGKSRLALGLCRNFNGEIISADSRQVYRYLDIGTAKPTPEEMNLVPHHLVDIIEPGEPFSLAQFKEMAYRAMEDIWSREKIPFLVGGSGLYAKALLENWQIPCVSPDSEFRDSYEKLADEEGTAQLYQKLLKIDPGAAGKIGPNNLRRIIRALEVHNKTQTAFSSLGQKKEPGFGSLVIGLTTDRAALYRIVDERIDVMFERGLVGEVENLLKMGYDFTLPAMSGIGYRQVGQYLRGELSLDAARQKMKTETHRFIRHQYAWFRLRDENIHWFDIKDDNTRGIKELVRNFLGIE
ncbi:MAG: tRNA (adenosine(37)-N6)-dimethylallyltransferase MiaA [Dehalococcoidia bacterium]|jgi:tRNA dimethylallyltransferase